MSYYSIGISFSLNNEIDSEVVSSIPTKCVSNLLTKKGKNKREKKKKCCKHNERSVIVRNQYF